LGIFFSRAATLGVSAKLSLHDYLKPTFFCQLKLQGDKAAGNGVFL
jgi:hypothetical protein